MLIYVLVVALISNLSTACLDCPLEDGDRGKLNLSQSQLPDEDYLKAIAIASRGLLSGNGLQQQKSRLYQKLMGQQHQRPPASSASPSSVSLPSPSNLVHVYTLLNRGSGAEPRLVVDDYFLQDPGMSKISKKAEKGMLVDVMDYVSKSEDRNRRVGQNMRSSG